MNSPASPASGFSPASGASSAFPPGSLSPNPTRAKASAVVRAQAKIESILFLRHGEQQLLSLIIPLCLLIGFSLLPVEQLHRPIESVYPLTLGIALMGAGFTGQAIAVAFDRRYGALKRIGASGVPTWALIAGKVAAVGVVVCVQIAVLTITALILGLHLSIAAVAVGILIVLLGIAAFTAMGLLLGGTLSSEMVLAVANTLWFLFMGAAVFTTITTGGGYLPHPALVLIPSVALTEGLTAAVTQGSIAWAAVGSLLVWALLASVLAVKLFRFTMDSD